jgi:hypothetical protein
LHVFIEDVWPSGGFETCRISASLSRSGAIRLREAVPVTDASAGVLLFLRVDRWEVLYSIMGTEEAISKVCRCLPNQPAKAGDWWITCRREEDCLLHHEENNAFMHLPYLCAANDAPRYRVP